MSQFVDLRTCFLILYFSCLNFFFFLLKRLKFFSGERTVLLHPLILGGLAHSFVVVQMKWKETLKSVTGLNVSKGSFNLEGSLS